MEEYRLLCMSSWHLEGSREHLALENITLIIIIIIRRKGFLVKDYKDTIKTLDTRAVHCYNIATIASKINATLKGEILLISNTIVPVLNLLAHNNISQICYCGQISLQSAAVNCSFCDNVTPLGVTFILLAMVQAFGLSTNTDFFFFLDKAKRPKKKRKGSGSGEVIQTRTL